MIFQPVRKFLVHITGFIKNFISSYVEVLRTGGIHTVATGENITIRFQANVSGDILVFIEPLNNGLHSYDEVLNLLSSDNKLNYQKELALHSLQQKYLGLMAVPKMFAGFIAVLLSLFVFWKASIIQSVFNYQIELVTIQKVVPLVILSIMFIFKKFIGFKAISIVIGLVHSIQRIWQRLKVFFIRFKPVK